MKYLILFLIGLFLISCNKSPDYETFINKQLTAHCDSLSQYTKVVIVPRQGCHSCVENADAYFFEYKDNKDCLFIFTHLVSEKLLRIELGYENLVLSNVKIDKSNDFYSLDYADSQYPIVLNKNSEGHFTYSFLDTVK